MAAAVTNLPCVLITGKGAPWDVENIEHVEEGITEGVDGGVDPIFALSPARADPRK